MRHGFLIERKSFEYLFCSQQRENGQLESMLDSQLSRLRNASDYTGRLLIVEVPNIAWKNDSMPDKFAVLIGVATNLRILQSEYCDLDQHGMPNVRVLRDRSPIDARGRLMNGALRPNDAVADKSLARWFWGPGINAEFVKTN